MAEPVKRGDKYRHSVMVGGVRKSGTFDTKKEARAWEASLRLQVKESGSVEVLKPKHKMTDAFDLYNSTISPLKKNASTREARLLDLFAPFFHGRMVEDITTKDIAAWRDDLLQRVSPSTVLRYRNLLSNVFTTAVNEWGWIKMSPCKGVKWPKDGAPRQKVWRWQQIKRMLREGQRRGGKYLETTQALRIALHTGMRLKEALAAPRGFCEASKVVILSDVKEQHNIAPVKVPLTKRGYRVMQQMPSSFEVDANEASTLFCKLMSQVGIKGLQFKDSRATALTLMSRRMQVEVLQRFSRHKDINILVDSYYRDTAEDISSRGL